MTISPPGVYRAQHDTELIAGAVRRLAHRRHVLDVGSGSGALTLVAARAGAASVTAVDLSRRSVATTWWNTRGHRVSVRHGDLFAPVTGRRFGLVVANPPYVPAPTAMLPRFGMGRCWDAGLDGCAVLDRLCRAAPAHLAPDGVLLLVHSAVCNVDRTLAGLAAAGMDAEVIDRGLVPFGPVMRRRAALLVARGLIEPGQTVEELVVVEARCG